MAILTVAELREHVTTSLEDDALQRLLDSSEAAIVSRAGAPGTRTEVFSGGHRFITTARPVLSITSIAELLSGSSTSLGVDDWFQRSPYVLERVNTGTNPRSRWWGRVTVVYEPVGDEALREEVQIALVQLAVNEHPGLQSERIGEWEETYSGTSVWNATAEREAILSRLNEEPQLLVVGGFW